MCVCMCALCIGFMLLSVGVLTHTWKRVQVCMYVCMCVRLMCRIRDWIARCVNTHMKAYARVYVIHVSSSSSQGCHDWRLVCRQTHAFVCMSYSLYVVNSSLWFRPNIFPLTASRSSWWSVTLQLMKRQAPADEASRSSWWSVTLQLMKRHAPADEASRSSCETTHAMNEQACEVATNISATSGFYRFGEHGSASVLFDSIYIFVINVLYAWMYVCECVRICICMYVYM